MTKTYKNWKTLNKSAKLNTGVSYKVRGSGNSESYPRIAIKIRKSHIQNANMEKEKREPKPAPPKSLRKIEIVSEEKLREEKMSEEQECEERMSEEKLCEE